MTNEDRKEIAQVFSKIATILSMYNPPNYSYVVKRSEYEVANFTNEIAVLRTLIEDMCIQKEEECGVSPLPKPILDNNVMNGRYLDTANKLEEMITQIIALPYGTYFPDRESVILSLLQFKENLDYHRIANK